MLGERGWDDWHSHTPPKRMTERATVRRKEREKEFGRIYRT